MQLYETQPPTLEDHNQARLEILEECSAFAQAATTTVTGCRVKDFCQAYNRRDPELNISATTYALVPTVERTTIYRWRRGGQPIAKPPGTKRPPKATAEQRNQARKAIVQEFNQFLVSRPGQLVIGLQIEFSDLYNARGLDLPDWVYKAVKSVSRSSLERWKHNHTEKPRTPRNQSILLTHEQSRAMLERIVAQRQGSSIQALAAKAQSEMALLNLQIELSIHSYKRALATIIKSNSQ